MLRVLCNLLNKGVIKMNEIARITSADIFNRQFIGFDRLVEHISSLQSNNYPPHNIVITGEDTREIEFALAGFLPDDVTVKIEDTVLTVSGESPTNEEKIYVHKGIAARSFKKQFNLAEYWEVENAAFSNGILIISLKQEIPEAKKLKTIKIEYKS